MRGGVHADRFYMISEEAVPIFSAGETRYALPPLGVLVSLSFRVSNETLRYALGHLELWCENGIRIAWSRALPAIWEVGDEAQSKTHAKISITQPGSVAVVEWDKENTVVGLDLTLMGPRFYLSFFFNDPPPNEAVIVSRRALVSLHG